MFRKFRTYSHIRMLDCAIHILSSYRVKDGRYKLKIMWFNKRGMDLGFRETVTVSPKEVKNWYEMKGL